MLKKFLEAEGVLYQQKLWSTKKKRWFPEIIKWWHIQYILFILISYKKVFTL